MNRRVPDSRRGGVPGRRLSVRLACREARRAKHRSALVVALIALPVFGLSFAAVTYDTFRLTARERTDRVLGRADAFLSWPNTTPIVQSPDGERFEAARGTKSPAKRAADPTIAEVGQLLPGRTRVLPYWTSRVAVRTSAGGVADLTAVGLHIGDAAAGPLFPVVTGRAPRQADEVALTRAAQERTALTIGSVLRTADGDSSYRIVGVVESPGQLHEPGVVFQPAAAHTGGSTAFLVDTPGPVTWPMVQQLNAHGIRVVSRYVLLHPPPVAEQRQLPVGTPWALSAGTSGIGMVVGGLAILEVVLLAGPAFTIGVRRRQRDLGLLAANGASPVQLRRIVLADGLILGVAGAVVGVALGVLAATMARPLLEQHIIGARSGALRVYPAALLAAAVLAVTAGLLAALVPASVAARSDVVSALSGRRGVTRARRRWVALGIVAASLGALLAGLGAWRVHSGLILAGMVAVETGLVLCTPAIVGAVSHRTAWLPLTPRIALRHVARRRAAAAPAISAVMASVAAAVTIGMYLAGSQAQANSQWSRSMPDGYAAIHLYPGGVPPTASDGTGEPDPGQRDKEAAGTSGPGADVQTPGDAAGVPHSLAAEDAIAAARANLPVRNTMVVTTPACAPGQGSDCAIRLTMPASKRCPYDTRTLSRAPRPEEIKAALQDPRCARERGYRASPGGLTDLAVVDDGTHLSMLAGLPAARITNATDTLRQGGVVVPNESYLDHGVATLSITRAGGSSEEVTVPALALTALAYRTVVIPPALLNTLNMLASPTLVLVATTRTPTRTEQDRATAAVMAAANMNFPADIVEVERGTQPTPFSPVTAILAGIAAMVSISATAIATALATAESRPELVALAAVGAPPRVRRLMSVSQAGVIAGLGALIGSAVGVGGAVSILTATNHVNAQTWPAPEPLPLVIPWQILGASLLVVPAVAMAGAALFTRARLPSERRAG